MKCPVCQKSMVILEFHSVEMDFCPSCEGCWLDRGELGLIISGTPDLPDEFKLAGERKSERRCPRCERRMRAGLLPATQVEVDVCDRQHGLWLDKGELQAIVRDRGAEKSAAAVAEFVMGVFGTKKNE